MTLQLSFCEASRRQSYSNHQCLHYSYILVIVSIVNIVLKANDIICIFCSIFRLFLKTLRLMNHN